MVWVFVFARRSCVHYWFVYGDFALTLSAAALAFALPLHDAFVAAGAAFRRDGLSAS